MRRTWAWEHPPMTHWDTRGYEGLSEAEKQELLYDYCDQCDDDDFHELCTWCFEYGKLALTYLHMYCQSNCYFNFARIIEEFYHHDRTGLSTIRPVSRNGRPSVR